MASNPSSTTVAQPDSLTREQVTLLRVFTDPIITCTPHIPFHTSNSPIRRLVIPARLAQYHDTPESDPVELASLPEAVLYLSTATLTDASMTAGDPAALYQHALTDCLTDWENHPVTNGIDIPEPDRDVPDHHTETLTTLRRALKAERDTEFLDTQYERLTTTAPKTTWQ